MKRINRALRYLYITFAVCASVLFFSFAAAFMPFAPHEGARNTLTVYFGGEKYYYYDAAIFPTDHVVAEEVRVRHINASPAQKSEYVNALIKAGYSKKKAILSAYPKLKEFCLSVKEGVYKDKRDSEIRFQPGRRVKFYITQEKQGRRLDENKFYADVYRAWQRSQDAVIYAQTQPIEPTVRSSDNRRLTARRATFSTDFSRSGADRRHNIALAASKISGVRLKEGEKFSFNKTVGQRGKEQGYKEAKIIVGGKYVDGIGGGVCQVSTTLYNAAIRALVDMDAVAGHSLAPSYVEPSFDAMVNSGTCDLCFTNNTGGDVFINAFCDDNTLTVEIYGLLNPYTVITKSVITKRGEVPPDEIIEDVEGLYTTDEDESGSLVRVRGGLAGFESEGYIMCYKEGALVSKRRLRRDKYLPIRGILAKKP